MKNKLLLLILLKLILGFSITAQESSNEFGNGLIIATKLNTIPPVAEDLLSENLTIFEYLPSDRKSLTRFIVDVKNQSFFGYKLLFSKIGETNQYKLSFKPLGDDFKPPQAPAYDYTNFKQKSLSKYPEEITLNDGDTVVLDLLENPKTKSKVQDFIKLTTIKSSTDNYFDKYVEPKDFSINDINLKLVDFKTLRNKEIISEKWANPLNSHIIAFHFRDKGKFILSAFPQEKHNFQKIGYIEDNKMYFGNSTDSYELVSKENILPIAGKWTLWGKFIPESETNSKIDKSLPFITEGYLSLDEPKIRPKKMVIKFINWY